MRWLFAVGVGLHLADVEKIVSAVNPPPLYRVDVDHAFGRATGRNDPHNCLEIQVVDLRSIDFDQPGMRVTALQNDLARERCIQGPDIGGKDGVGGASTLKSSEKD